MLPVTTACEEKTISIQLNRTFLAIFISLNMLCVAVRAQDSLFVGPKNKLGFVSGAGVQYVGQFLGLGKTGFNVASNYYYQVTFYELQYYRTLKKRPGYELDLLVQPQYNVVRYGKIPESTEYTNAYEFGVNIGVLYSHKWGSGPVSYYFSLSSGPHDNSGTPRRQINGFIFSDNLDAGLNLKLYKGLYADVRFGLRHMSNGSTRLPNAGINNLVFKEGFVVAF